MTKRSTLAGIVADATLEKGISKKYAEGLAAYILDNKMGDQIDSLMRDVQGLWAEQGYLEVLAASARPISASVISEIKKQVKAYEPSAKTIVITQVLDPEVIGGVKISLPGRQLDLSVEAKLNKFKRAASGGKD